MAITKLKNKAHGYHCDRCNVVPKVIFSNNKGFLCEKHAEEEYGVEAVKTAELEED